MAKKVHSISIKGILDLNFDEGKGIITEITKEEEIPYDFFEIINEFNGKQVSITIKEENDLEPIEE